jgi:predicted enzyme related to lactoylglutathione lyase
MINIETKKINKTAGQIISELMDYEANGRIQLVVDTALLHKSK